MPATEFAGTVYTSVFVLSQALDLANHTAVASVDTTVANADVKAGDVIVPIAPAALNAGIVAQGCHTIVDGSFKLRTTNPSAGAIDPASQTWSFLVFRR